MHGRAPPQHHGRRCGCCCCGGQRRVERADAQRPTLYEKLERIEERLDKLEDEQ